MKRFYLYGLIGCGRVGFHYIGVTKDRKDRLREHRKRWPGCTMVTLVIGHADYIYELEAKAIAAYKTRKIKGGSNHHAGGWGGWNSARHHRSNVHPMND